MKYTAVFTHISEVDNLGRLDVAFELRGGSSIITAGTTGAKLNELKNPSLIINHKIII